MAIQESIYKLKMNQKALFNPSRMIFESQPCNAIDELLRGWLFIQHPSIKIQMWVPN